MLRSCAGHLTRFAMYIKTMAFEWALLGAVVMAWVIGGSPWDALGGTLRGHLS